MAQCTQQKAVSLVDVECWGFVGFGFAEGCVRCEASCERK
jgi:hypothetical protein